MKKVVYFNLNFDDFHPQNDKDGDFGGLNGDVNRKIVELWEKFPDLKITMFTTPNWVDRPFLFSKYYYYLRFLFKFFPVVKPFGDEPFNLLKHPEWCSWVRDEVKKGRLEIAVHGYNHHNPVRVIHGQEFLGLNSSEVENKLSLAEEIFERAEIPFVKGFRPPGWGMADSLTQNLLKRGYEFFGPYPSSYRLSKVGDLDGLKIVPQNYSISESASIALGQAEENGVVFAKGHLAHNYGKEIISNGLSEENFVNLMSVISSLQDKYDVRFVSLSEYIKMV